MVSPVQMNWLMNTGHTARMTRYLMPTHTASIIWTTSHKSTWHFAISLLILLLSISSAFANDINKESILKGKNIYMQGILTSGKDVIATTAGDVQLMGEQAACVNCHRHSGLGSTEGSTVTPAITGEILFSEKKIKAHRYQPLTEQTPSALDRPAYTENSLKNTLMTGIDANGKPLDILMPRYVFTEYDYNNLYNYLNSLSIQDAGVTDTTLHIATVIDNRASPEKIKTLLQTLETFISDLNSGTRRESERASQAPIQKEWSYQGYRQYKLHVWNLTGEPDSWQEQLNSYYDKTPVFAIASGISEDNWKNIDDFCNAREVPCILPNTRTPGFSGKNFYTLYYTAGPYNDASVIASYFHDKNIENNEAHDIVQLYDATSYSEIAKDILHDEITSSGKHNIASVSLETISSKHDIDQHITNKDTTIIIWSEKLDASLLEALSRNKNKIKSVFIPYYLATSIETRNKLSGIGVKFFTSYPYVAPASEPRDTIRSSAWGKSKKIDMTEKAVFTNTFTAIKVFINAIKHLRSNFNRDYMIELLEHKLDNSVFTGMYPKLTIGPNQRYASRGGYIMDVPEDTSLPLQPVTQWLLPEKQVKLTQP